MKTLIRIDCKKELPEKEDDYFVETTLSLHEIMTFEKGEWSGDLWGDGDQRESVIHWYKEM